MSRKVEFQLDVEIEVHARVTPFRKGTRDHKFDQPGPDEPSEVEDIYVGVIIKGTAIDITALLNPKQIDAIREECFTAAIDAEGAEDDERFERERNKLAGSERFYD